MKPIIGLNGPPGAGKTFIMNEILQLIPDATKISIQDGLFKLHKERCQQINAGMTYAEYKASDYYDRQALIETARLARATRGESVFVRMAESSEEFKAARVVLFDNIGLAADHYWAVETGRPYLLLRIDTPFMWLEPVKASRRTIAETWHGDSRRPFMHNLMLTAYDSEQMKMLLRYLHFAGGNGAIPESSPYHEYAKLWRTFLGDRRSVPSTHAG